MFLENFTFFIIKGYGGISVGMCSLLLLLRSQRRSRLARPVFALILCGLWAVGLRAQQKWSPVGPPGGDARAFAAVPGDPSHIYLGTTNSWLYESNDSGASWHRLARMQGSNAYVLDHILVDPDSPTTIYIAAWQADNPQGGGLWISHDAGRTWQESAGLHGQSILAFAQAPSNPHILFAGTLRGVFRSDDSGVTWTQISPPDSHEIHEIESLAVDPNNPDVVYAGTWHLPWKTTNGGRSWSNIKRGLIVDSDVFSIIIDPQRTKTVYLSACSGIYKSETAGALFHKIQGIPNSARRTRVLRQDPTNPQVVYAGTTEGLYKTTDGGRTFRRMTAADVIVNDVFVDPRNPQHVLLATDRGGVLASNDGGETFVQSNTGISERKVEALLVDRTNPQRIYVGVVNDKNYGGVFVSNNGGRTWAQQSSGLDGRDVYVLAQTSDGKLVAGTNAGIFELNRSADPPVWEPRNEIANMVTRTVTETHFHTRVNVEKQTQAPMVELDGRVMALDVSGEVWVASTSHGLLTSHDKGATWQGGPVMGASDYDSVTHIGKLVAAARPNGVVLSEDSGLTWWPMGLPKMLTRIRRIAFAQDGTLWLGAREGVYFSRDKGKTWMWVDRLPFRDVDDLAVDAATKRVLVSSRNSDQIFAIDPKTLTWNWYQTGYPVALIRAAGGRMVAASVHHGVLLEPGQTGEKLAQTGSVPAAQ